MATHTANGRYFSTKIPPSAMVENAQNFLVLTYLQSVTFVP
ncbi:hypothetical protein [Eubacterium coprostanoligenes]|nr:hypothetical protein [Eubacterium coprostanoligenes]MDY4699061.1 hypothetical protein [Eubacterium coprostanoligenes]